MAMASTRMESVRKIEENREQDAARAWGAAQRKVAEEEARLQELLRYQIEYQQGFQDRARTGISASQLQDYQAFICKLNTAIEQQGRLVRSCQTESQQKKQAWQARYTRKQAIGKVVARYQEQDRRLGESREQKESDEFGLRPRMPSP
jgi:flagellar FliJ protein